MNKSFEDTSQKIKIEKCIFKLLSRSARDQLVTAINRQGQLGRIGKKLFVINLYIMLITLMLLPWLWLDIAF